MEPKQDRNLDHLHPLFREPFENWLAAVEAAGYDLLVYETFRTPQRQAWLYDAGRKRSPYGRYLTYTLDSLHRYGCAADSVVQKNGEADWNGYKQLYADAPPEQFGLERLDFEQPHVQLGGGQARARELGIVRDVLVGSKAPSRPAPSPPAGTPAGQFSFKVPLYSPYSNEYRRDVTLISKPDGSFKVYDPEEQ